MHASALRSVAVTSMTEEDPGDRPNEVAPGAAAEGKAHTDDREGQWVAQGLVVGMVVVVAAVVAIELYLRVADPDWREAIDLREAGFHLCLAFLLLSPIPMLHCLVNRLRGWGCTAFLVWCSVFVMGLVEFWAMILLGLGV